MLAGGRLCDDGWLGGVGAEGWLDDFDDGWLNEKTDCSKDSMWGGDVLGCCSNELRML